MPTMTLTENVSSYEGRRLKPLGVEQIFLVLDGKRRYIPDFPTYQSVFGTATADEVVNIETIDEGVAISSGAVLAEADSGEPAIYLITNDRKRHILSPEAMTQYGFLGTVHKYPKVVMDAILKGDTIPKT